MTESTDAPDAARWSPGIAGPERQDREGVRPGERRGRGRLPVDRARPARAASRTASLRGGAPAAGGPPRRCRRARPAPRPTRRSARSRPVPASSPRSAGCRKGVDSRTSSRSVRRTAARRPRLGKDGDRPGRGRVQLVARPPRGPGPRGEKSMPDLGCRRSSGDRVPEQVSGDVLAVVLAIAPFAWAVRSFCCAATPSPDSPGPSPLDCSARPPRPSPPRPQPQFGPGPASRRGRSARPCRGRDSTGTRRPASPPAGAPPPPARSRRPRHRAARRSPSHLARRRSSRRSGGR